MPFAAQRPERVTRADVRDVPLPDGGILALVVLDPGSEQPTTFGPQGIAVLADTFRHLHERVGAGELTAVAVTGGSAVFAAGADLTQVAAVTDRADALALARAGHAAYGLLADLDVPTFAFVNGAALGGGLELALHCDHRTVAADVRALGLPETSLGLVPGWGGCHLLPRLVGVEAALDVILTRAAANAPLSAGQAVPLGLADTVLDRDGFLDASVRWAAGVLRGEVTVTRRPLDAPGDWRAAVDVARAHLDATVHGARLAPYRALELVAAGPDVPRAEAYAAEDEALADLVMSDEMRASVYAFGLVQGAKRPAGAPDGDQARPVTRVGVVGAGLMAAQIATLAARRLAVPVVMRDLDQTRVTAGLTAVRSGVQRLVAAGRMTAAEADRIVAAVSGTTDLADLAGCDLVVEAVTEILDLKKRVFAELEPVVGPTAVLATNTSALSVGAMAAALEHPERVVGLHFFNPVASMPLVEVAHAAHTSPQALATAVAVAGNLGKTPVLVADRPGFVVNRLLVLLLGLVLEAVDQGTPVEVADAALDPLGLPMRPFALLDLVGPAVGQHVLTSLRADLGERFPRSPGLERVVAEGLAVTLPPPARGLPRPVDPALHRVFGVGRDGGRRAPNGPALLARVLTALTTEVGLLLDEGVVPDVRQIDLCMLLGAGWGGHLGGICPYLDRTGYSARVLGHRLLPDGVANVPTVA